MASIQYETARRPLGTLAVFSVTGVVEVALN
jgi:hypothetical protein